MKNKKYYSIAEACEIIGISAHKLRYLEKAASDIKIFKIRGRRYYTQTDIHNIQIKFGITNFINDTNIVKIDNNEILSKIDELLSKFTELSS